ncbi:MAG: TA system VapC family ribonuclease toxin [Acidobacteriota bacterium]
MQRSLVDVNIWLSLLVRQHQHHRIARKWYEALDAAEAGLCRFVQLGLIRLLGNRSIMGSDAISAVAAWDLIDELLADERVEFVSEPPDFNNFFPSLLSYSVPTGKLVGDAYLAAFALSASRRLVTLDAGFRQFRGLDLEVIGSARH